MGDRGEHSNGAHKRQHFFPQISPASNSYSYKQQQFPLKWGILSRKKNTTKVFLAARVIGDPSSDYKKSNFNPNQRAQIQALIFSVKSIKAQPFQLIEARAFYNIFQQIIPNITWLFWLFYWHSIRFKGLLCLAIKIQITESISAWSCHDCC